jgi:hypothetical protein
MPKIDIKLENTQQIGKYCYYSVTHQKNHAGYFVAKDGIIYQWCFCFYLNPNAFFGSVNAIYKASYAKKNSI